jgi:hypothetical protein
MPENNKKIESISELLKYSFELSQNTGSLLYRGQAHYQWPLIPSVYRRFERYQAVILEAFLLYILDIQTIKKSHIYTNHPIEFLAMCQHYNIPTRLLDWSDKILTGLYFACEDTFDKNGKSISKDGALYLCKKDKFNKLQLNNFRKVTSEPLLVEANVINPRMNSQSGSFMLWGAIPLNSETSETYSLDEYCKSSFENNPIEKLIIPKERKKEFLNELYENYGINKETIYLNNESTKKLEKQYRIFKRTSSIITHEMTNWEKGKSLFDLNINLAGCLNLQALPKNPENFSELITEIINYDKDLVGRNDPCVCRSGKKYKKCCKI